MTDTSQSIYEQVTQADRDRARRILAGEEPYMGSSHASSPAWWLGALDHYLGEYVDATDLPVVREGRAERARIAFAVFEQLVVRWEVTR